MISSAHGLHVDLHDLRRRFPVSLKGVTLAQLIAQAGTLGFAARAVRLDLDELHRLGTPCILHWGLNHFVVLKRVMRRHVVILDPAVGERRLRRAEVSRHFTGVALELTPTPGFRKEDRRARIGLRQLAGKVTGLKRSLAQILAIALVLELFVIAAPLLNQMVVDNVLTSADHDLLNVLVLGFGLLLVAQVAIGLARSWMIMVLGQTLHLQWSGNLFAHLLRLPVDYFEKRHLGDIVSRFGSMGAIQRAMTTAVIEAVLDGLMALAAFTMMLVYAPSLCAVVAAAVAAYGMLRWAGYRPLREASAERLVLSARESTHFLETLRAMAPLKLFGGEYARSARWHNLVVDVQNRDTRTAQMNIGFAAGNSLIFGIENLTVLWLGAKLVLGGHAGAAAPFTVGMLFAFIGYKSQFTTRVPALIDRVVELRMLRLHAERLADIVLHPPETDVQLPEHDLGHLQACIELREVGFRYGDGDPWVFRHATLRVEAGEHVAITGPSGSGKTTLLKILLGLLTPTEGEIFYGGVPVRRLGVANVRRQLGAVMQDDVLLTGSITDNIGFFEAQPDPAFIEACARLANLHDEIARMPMGYHTLIGDLGAGLSGGQRQRLLLARALYKRPRVLVLDEATSDLDVANERAIVQATACMNLTRIVVAHRPETVARAGRVLLLHDGHFREPQPAIRARRSRPERQLEGG